MCELSLGEVGVELSLGEVGVVSNIEKSLFAANSAEKAKSCIHL